VNRFAHIYQELLTEWKRPREILFYIFTLSILVISLVYFILSIGKPYMGLVLTCDEQGWSVSDLDPNGLAIEAGINIGDRPTEINHQPASTFLEEYIDSGMVYSDSIKQLTVTNENGQLESVSLEGKRQSDGALAELISLIIVSLIFWITGFYVFFKRPQSITSMVFCLCGVVFGLAVSAGIATDTAIPLALQFGVAAAIFGPWLLLHFFLILPEERTRLRRNRLTLLIYLLPAITLILFLLIGQANGQPLPGFRAVRFFVYGLGYLAAAGVVIFNYFGTSSTRTRQQMKTIFLSALIALVPFLILNILPEVIWKQPILPAGFSILFIVFIPVGMGHAVITQKLMDIDIVIRRGLIYGLITAIMAIILAVAIFSIAANYTTVEIPVQILTALVLGGVATALFGPIKKRIEILIDRLFYKDRYDYRQIIQSLSTSLHTVNDFNDVSRLIVGTLVQSLNSAGGCLFVKTQSGSYEVGAAQGTLARKSRQKILLKLLSQQDHSIEFPSSASSAEPGLAFIIPLVAADKEIGILFLSEKASRQRFSTDDMYLLQGLASVAAVALRNAMLIRDVSMRDNFVSIASHELRTPMTAIMGYTELLLQRNPSDTTREKWLIKIYDNSRKLTNMIDDLLNVTRIQSGKISMKLEKVRLQDILEESMAFTRESSDKHEITVTIEPDLPAVLIDREKFGQVIGNLLGNAIKYSPQGGRITLSARKDLENPRVVVSVCDEGIGISPEDKDTLFTTFHRIRRPETQGIKGSGLGLYISKEWTEAMGGEIWLESEINKGSTFFVAIPVCNINDCE
jgi:signal transduction histidine kinase